MNFFPAHIRKDDGKLYIDMDSNSVKIPDNKTSVYDRFVGKEVIFGTRPEDIHNPDFAPPSIHAEPITATVDVTELMGNEIFLYLVAGKNNFTARVDPRTRFSIGDRVQMVINMDNMHIFDPSVDRENPAAVR
jgi:multiple sugar transport system ATP-binding protein